MRNGLYLEIQKYSWDLLTQFGAEPSDKNLPVWWKNLSNGATGFYCEESRSPLSRVSQSNKPPRRRLRYLLWLFAVWLNTKSFYCCKILIFILKWNNQLWALFRRAGGDLSGLIVSRVYARSVLTPHARQSKARLRGLFCMNSLTGPRRTEGRVCTSLPHIHASVPRLHHRCRVMITHTSPSDRGTWSRVWFF